MAYQPPNPSLQTIKKSDRRKKRCISLREFARHCISREKKSVTQNNEDLRPKIIQIIKNVKTLCFSSRKFSPNVKSHAAPRKVAKTRRRTLGLPTTKPNPTFYETATEAQKRCISLREFARHCISREKKSITQNNKDLRPKMLKLAISREMSLCT